VTKTRSRTVPESRLPLSQADKSLLNVSGDGTSGQVSRQPSVTPSVDPSSESAEYEVGARDAGRDNNIETLAAIAHPLSSEAAPEISNEGGFRHAANAPQLSRGKSIVVGGSRAIPTIVSKYSVKLKP
jgi:hypothetical protein